MLIDAGRWASGEMQDAVERRRKVLAEKKAKRNSEDDRNVRLTK